MRKINITIQIEDDDHVETKLRNSLVGWLGSSMTDYTKLTDTSELYDNDPVFRKLCAGARKAKKLKNDYINSKK